LDAKEEADLNPDTTDEQLKAAEDESGAIDRIKTCAESAY
jgi:hypothetical protein